MQGKRSNNLTSIGRFAPCVALSCLIFTIALFASGPAAAAAPDKNAPKKSDSEDNDPQQPMTEEPAGAEPAEEDDEPLPTIDKMELPSFQRLMQGPPVDWLVLHIRKVIVCEPVAPRPGTLEDIDQRTKRLMRRAGDPPESDEAKTKRLEMYYLPVTLLEGEEREYKLHVKYIKEIVYYEDLMLRRIDQLLDDRQVRQAYELIVALEERQETWRGIVPRRERLLFTESVVKLDEREPQQALALLEALHERNSKYNGLEVQFGTVIDRLISGSQAAGDHREVRYFLRRLARRYPNHQTVKDWTARLLRETRELLDKALASERSGQIEEALDIAETASRVWPELPEVLPVYNRLAGRLFRGCVWESSTCPKDDHCECSLEQPPRGRSAKLRPVVLSAAEHRRKMLTQTRLFEPARFENKTVRYESRFFSDWDPAELGHSVLFRLRPYRIASESGPLVTAAGLADALGRRLDPRTVYYDARFAAIVESLEVRSPFELAVRFRQVPLRPEPLFVFPCPPRDRSESVELASLTPEAAGLRDTPTRNAPNNNTPNNNDTGGVESAATFPFELRSRGPDRAVYRRAISEPEGVAARHVAEVVEVKYPSYDTAIQGLLRGEVTMLARGADASSSRRLAIRN